MSKIDGPLGPDELGSGELESDELESGEPEFGESEADEFGLDGSSSPTEGAGQASDSQAGSAAHPGFDHARAAAAVRELLIAAGEDPDREGLQDTPQRVARAYQELFAGLYTDPDEVLDKTFNEAHEELVLVREIPMYSFCEHHLLPFHGYAHVGYIPNEQGRVTGLSKLARLVELYARRPQVQERLTSQVADALVRRLEPRGVIVVVEAEHLCMGMRGVRKAGSTTTTSAVRGIFRSSASSRSEALELMRGK